MPGRFKETLLNAVIESFYAYLTIVLLFLLSMLPAVASQDLMTKEFEHSYCI